MVLSCLVPDWLFIFDEVSKQENVSEIDEEISLRGHLSLRKTLEFRLLICYVELDSHPKPLLPTFRVFCYWDVQLHDMFPSLRRLTPWGTTKGLKEENYSRDTSPKRGLPRSTRPRPKQKEVSGYKSRLRRRKR